MTQKSPFSGADSTTRVVDLIRLATVEDGAYNLICGPSESSLAQFLTCHTLPATWMASVRVPQQISRRVNLGRDWWRRFCMEPSGTRLLLVIGDGDGQGVKGFNEPWDFFCSRFRFWARLKKGEL